MCVCVGGGGGGGGGEGGGKVDTTRPLLSSGHERKDNLRERLKR